MRKSLTLFGDARSYFVRQAWYRKQANALTAQRNPQPKRRLMVDVSLIAKQDARTGIQRAVRGIWVALLDRASGVELIPVVASRRHGYTAVTYFRNGQFGPPADDPKPVSTRRGDIFLGLDLSAHLLPIHSQQIALWKRRGVTINIVCYDLLPQTHPQFFTKRTRLHYARWIDWVLKTADTLFCISNDVATQISKRVTASGVELDAPVIQRLDLGGNLLASVPSVGIRPGDTALLERVRLKSAMLMVGTLEPRKAYPFALDAFEQLWSAGFDCHLVIVGKIGWKSQSLVERLRKHPRRGSVLHWIEDASDEFLDKLYESSSGLLVTSRAEGFCLPIIEAAKHGLPILSRDIPVLREHVYADQQFFDDESVSGLASAIRSFLASKGERLPRGRVPSWAECGEALLRDLGLSDDDPRYSRSD